MVTSPDSPWKRFETKFETHYEDLLVTLVVLCLALVTVGVGFLVWSRIFL